jgi:hypothetical protein
VNEEFIQRIRERAYKIWEEKGRSEGQEIEHWLEAERELSREGVQAPEISWSDLEGLAAAREYNRDDQDFGNETGDKGGAELAAQQAKDALDGAEGVSPKHMEMEGAKREDTADPHRPAGRSYCSEIIDRAANLCRRFRAIVKFR